MKNNGFINGNKIQPTKKKKRSEIKQKTSMTTKSESQSNILKYNSKLNKENIIEKIKNTMEYIDEEKNVLSYELAIQYDKRSFCEYYISLLKTKHLLINSFFYNNDYNSRIIKIDLFFINLIINYAVNALFFTDDTMHKIYVDQGSFDFVYQLPKIIYSSLIPVIINKVLKLLSLSSDAIINFKEDKSKENINKRGKDLENKIKIKFIIYTIISFIVLPVLWYYLSIFGAIYRNTQYHLLKDTLISFGLSLIYPFFIYLIPGFFRIPALSNPKNKRKYLYNLSLLFQML
jgi:hypothetical protein